MGATLAHLTPGPPIAVAEWAKRLVGNGFESLWTPQVIGRGFFVPDPFVTLAVAATATEGVELGTATVQVPLHHPAELAHRIRSLRSVCGDRLTLGVSPGSTDLDYAHLDRDYTALPDLPREPAAAAESARPRAAPTAPRLVGHQRRAGRPRVRRLAGVGVPPHPRARPGPGPVPVS
ncbi:LLM class flavin-dependent oxidoreductase [Amycolatopsis sp. NBC_00348]|uniref:LLM class flavin-dependent oxidoreductase n=1 Tax=Amycolatopsis sp. NBC_00348 TaxID=2975956 RepID=UPI002E26BC7B